MTEESLERGVELLEELVTTDRDRAVFEIEVSGKDGETHVMEDHLALLEDEDGSIQGSVGVLRNIEDRKAHERELERYARLIEASGDAVYALDDDGRFTFSNDAHQEMVDRPKSEVLGAHPSIALSEKAFREGEALIRELLESDRRQGTFEMDVIQPDGTRIPTENNLALLTEADGEFRGTVGVLRDISERQAREAELRRQNERLERFAEIASHDLRNPLNVAQGYLEMLRKGVDSEHAERIGDALDRMERLIDDTLTMARQGVTVDEPTAVELAALARESWDAVADDADSLEVGEDVTLKADEGRLRQVLENLFRNAIEHGGEGVTVRIGAIDQEGFYVEDGGPGIDPDQRDAVFEAGHTTSATGTGFGLAIVSEVVNAHGWSIAVTESDGGGARFEITGVDVEP
jgi:PAS domain S-box-containing protein